MEWAAPHLPPRAAHTPAQTLLPPPADGESVSGEWGGIKQPLGEDQCRGLRKLVLRQARKSLRRGSELGEMQSVVGWEKDGQEGEVRGRQMEETLR